MANLPSGDGTSESAQMADLAIDLADQLINAFQQVADGAGDGEGEVTLDDGTLPFDNGARDVEVEAKDGNSEWQDLNQDEDDGDPSSDGYDNEVKGEGVGEENPSSWVSPLHNHDYSADETETAEAYHSIRGTVDVEFAVAKVLNFDDSDGDDLPTVMDERFIPRGVFVQSDFLVNRPELHGSEEVDMFSSAQAGAMMQGADHSQNVRIIEGHDDLELDHGAGGGGGYTSLATHNRFLQTQVVQLPSLTPEDHNMSANLYDSLEREEEEEEEDLYPEDEQDQEEGEDDRGSSGGGRDCTGGGEDGYHIPRDVHPLKPDGHHMEEEDIASVGFTHDVQQHHPWATERGDHGSGRNVFEDATANAGHHSPSRNGQRSASPLSPHSRCRDQETLPAQPMLTKVDSPKDLNQNHPMANGNEEMLSNINRGATGLVVNIPKLSSSGGAVGGSNFISGSEGMADSEQSTTVEAHHEPSLAHSKQPANTGKPQQRRGGSMGSNGGGGTRNAGSKSNQRSAANTNLATDQRTSSAARGRGRGGLVGSVRQVAGGAQSQRPAVQGAAVAGISSGGDGDGAVAGGNNTGSFVASGPSVGHPGGAVVVGLASGSMLSSRTSSQGSIHSNTSNNSNSRVSGVGKESNSNRGNQPSRGVGRSCPGGRPGSGSGNGSQYSAAGARPVVPPTQPSLQQQQQLQRQQQQQQQPISASGSLQQLQAGRSARQPPSMGPLKQGAAGGGARPRGDNRTLQLQQQQNQLKQEQQQLQLQKRQLQQQQQHNHQQQGIVGLPTGGMESPDGDHLVHHQPEAVVTQVGHMQQESQRQGILSNVNEVQGMEEVRSVLQGMLRLPREPTAFDQRGFDFADSASDLLMDRPSYHLEGDNNSLSGLRHGQEDMAEMFESFPSFSYKMFSDMSAISSVGDRSVNSELAYLRESLEKERYRRKHCEQQIQNLNGKLLEVQQQLAVAISTDKRKDIMIDQLDKQLAKVVEGWKKRETEKDEYMSMVMKEKAQIEETLQKQQTMIDSFEGELASTVEELKREKENSSSLVDKMKAELSTAVHNQHHAEELLEAEQERVTLMERDWEQLKESRDLAEKRAQQAQDRLHQEQDNWYQREQDLLSKIDQVKEANLKVMQMERVKLEQQTKKAEEMEEKLHVAETTVKKLEMEFDSSVREKESLKVEMALTEAKFESAQRSLEADLHAQMEKKIADEVCSVQERLRQEQEDQEEKHRNMVAELHQRHQRDMEVQMGALRQDLSRKENDLKQQLAESEASLNEYRQENVSLKQAKQKLESQRVEVLSKLQLMMQSQWNEAVSLLVSTPQRKSLNASLSSSMTSGLGALASSTYPQFNMAASAPPAAQTPSARVSSPRATSNQNHRATHSTESASFNNLSGSQSSAHSSPCTSPDPRSGQASAKAASTTLNAASSSKPTVFPSGSGSSFSLQDLSAMLSEGRYLPPNQSATTAPTSSTANVHGVMHNGGVVLQQAHIRPAGEEEDNSSHHPPHHQQQQRAVHQHQHPREGGDGPQGQAVLMRPPQQSSSASHRSGSLMLSHDEDFSFISTSDLSRADLSLLSSSQQQRHQQGPALWSQQFSSQLPAEDRSRERGDNSRHDRRERGGGAGNGREERGGAMHLFEPESDRMLELSDLELASRTSVLASVLTEGTGRGGLLMVNGGGGLAEGDTMGSEAILAQRSVPTYSPSLSPPVKQGRGGEQDSTDGDVERENYQLNSSYREISRQLEEHQSRQRELQHYIRVLLEKPPQSVTEQPERDSIGDPDAMEISFTSVAVDLGLTDAAQADQLSTELQRLQQLRDRQKAQDQLSHSVPPRRGGVGGGASRKPAPSDSHAPPYRGVSVSNHLQCPLSQSRQDTAGGGVSPQQLAEISRLLGQYSEDVEASSAADRLGALQADPASMAQILNFLAALPHQQLGEGSQKSSSAKNSPKQQQGRRTRDAHRSKQHADARHHSIGPDTSAGSLGSIDKHDKVMASSSRSSTSTSRKTEKKSTNGTSTSASAASSSSSKHSTRSTIKDQHHHPPVWKPKMWKKNTSSKGPKA